MQWKLLATLPVAGIEPAPAAYAAVHHCTTLAFSSVMLCFKACNNPVHVQCNLSNIQRSYATLLQVPHATMQTLLVPSQLARYLALELGGVSTGVLFAQ